jgi:hypothetical protein
MSHIRRNELRYVSNTNGGATVGAFIEDHEPLGFRLWDELHGQGLVRIDPGTNRIHLTDAGEQARDQE